MGVFLIFLSSIFLSVPPVPAVIHAICGYWGAKRRDAETQRFAEKRREKALSAPLCGSLRPLR